MVKIKNFFVKVGRWFKNHAPTKRRLIQVYTALLYNANIKGFFTGRIYTGDTKKACLPGLNCYSCPGAVGACPLGALQDSLAHSDTTAPYYIIGILALLGLLLGRTICGFFCPVGLGQELLYKIKTPKLKKSRYTRLLSYLKYILLIVLVISIPLIYHGIPAFCKYICPAGTFEGALGLLSNPNNENYFDQLGYLFSWKFSLLIAIIIACIFIYRCFCRFICPLGAIYSFFNKFALIGVKLDKQKCVDCGMCLQTCKMDIMHVGDHECINCGECIPVCPTKAISWKGSQIIVHGLEKTCGESEKAPLAAILTNGETAATLTAEAVANGGSNATVTAVIPEQTQEECEERAARVEAKLKKRIFWLQFGAWVLALVVLIGALVYYNFIDKSVAAQTSYTVGDECPDYTFSTIFETSGAFDENGDKIESVSVSDFKGTVTVLNFWYTLCDPCKEELPDFSEIKQEYGDSVNVVVVHIVNSATDASVQATINALGWNDWDLLFVRDTTEINCFESLGGKDVCPMTVIIDAEGIITFSYTGKLSGKEALEKEIDNALNN